MTASGHRSPEEVFEDHLRLRLEGNLTEDLRRNYAEDVVLLTVNSNARGHDAIRMSAQRLNQQLPDAEFTIVAKQVNGPFALLIWSASSARFNAIEGADSFVIKDGKIVFQSIHYGLRQHGHHGDGVTTKGHGAIAERRVPAVNRLRLG